MFGAINVDESEEFHNDDDEHADDTPEPKQQRKHLPSRPPTSSASFRLPTTRPTTAAQPAASASFSLRNGSAAQGGSPRSPDSPPRDAVTLRILLPRSFFPQTIFDVITLHHFVVLFVRCVDACCGC